MKRIVYGTVVVLLLVSAFLAGRFFHGSPAPKNAALERQILYYVDPMNPSHTSDKPGFAPCGMKMEPVYADEGMNGQAPDNSAASLPPGAVRISPEKQQVIGVRLGTVEKAAVNRTVRTVGRVAADEKRVYRLVAGVDGWIKETYNNDTGTLVRKNEKLASFYSPQFRAAQIAYLSLFDSPEDRFQAGGRTALSPSQQASISLRTYVEALQSLGMSEQQIKELGKTREVTDKVYIVAPATGFILARNVSPGQQFDKGAEWYRIADLGRVWVLADLFQNEAEYIKPGMKVKVTLPHGRKGFHATVSTVLPQFDPSSRTLKVRLEMDNPGYVLKPDMFVDVDFPVSRPSAITVPSEAVLDSGIKKTVFVDRGDGFFEPRQVETGWRMGDRVEITKGLMAGEQIVVSGNFFVDSESRMKMAAMTHGKADVQRVRDPVCGMEVDVNYSRKEGLAADYGGKPYYFCMKECKETFLKGPEGYTGKVAGAEVSRKAMAHD